MIKTKVNKGEIEELHAEGTVRQLLAEVTVIVKRICYMIGEQEETEFEKTKVYASTMLMVADGLTEVLKHEKVFEKLETLANKSET